MRTTPEQSLNKNTSFVQQTAGKLAWRYPVRGEIPSELCKRLRYSVHTIKWQMITGREPGLTYRMTLNNRCKTGETGTCRTG